MALVSVTGRVTDHSHVPLTGRNPRLWFRPNRPNLGADGLLAGSTWTLATLTGTGTFTVLLDNSPGVFYTPVLQYLRDPGQPESWGFDEWPMTVYPGPVGGSITDLSPRELTIYTVLVSVEDPPPGYRGWWLHAGPGDPDDVTQTGTGELREVTG